MTMTRLSPIETSLETLRTSFLLSHPEASTSLIDDAATLAVSAHATQFRRTREPYVTHVIAVAQILADLGLDDTTLAAALLHDVVEDTPYTIADISQQFTQEIAQIVDGVTKLSEIEFDSKVEAQAATIRKMFIAMAKDWRVLLIKLADRLHNMRTLAAMPPAHQKRVAHETLDVYAPLADRLGLQPFKAELEDLCFAVLHPMDYATLAERVTVTAPTRDAFLDAARTKLQHALDEAGIPAEVTGRTKHLYSLYRKMQRRNKSFDEIYDLIGLRILTTTIPECWAILGTVHALWSPIPDRFKDYINTPKFNLYQSLHTTVIGPDATPLEVQIRTFEMHRTAEYGAAAHWGYKSHASVAELAWMQRLIEVQDDPDPIAFLEALKLDLGADEVYAFTPKGRVIALVEGATPIDFAYTVHTEVGHRTTGAKVNGRLVPLSTPLHSGDVVEIVTGPRLAPSRDWLSVAKSSRAKSKIRQFFTAQRKEEARHAGNVALLHAARASKLPLASLTSPAMLRVVHDLGLRDLDALYIAIASSNISPPAVLARLERIDHPDTPLRAPRPIAPARLPEAKDLDDVLLVLARCCAPLPGDPTMGFVTQGRGVSVHRTTCKNALDLAARHPERVMMVDLASSSVPYRAEVHVHAFDRPRLLLDVSTLLAARHLNVLEVVTTTRRDASVLMRIKFDLPNPAQLGPLLEALGSLEGVYEVQRPGRT